MAPRQRIPLGLSRSIVISLSTTGTQTVSELVAQATTKVSVSEQVAQATVPLAAFYIEVLVPRSVSSSQHRHVSTRNKCTTWRFPTDI